MNTIRRLYFYTLALISALVVVWGVISLLRTLTGDQTTSSGSSLATGLSLTLVGIPIFILHWFLAQRDAARDPDEKTSRIRAVFLYAAMGSTLGPIVFAVISWLNRLTVLALRLSMDQIWFGSDVSDLDHGIAIGINAIAAAYFWSVLRKDWQTVPARNHLQEARRLYRYLWMVASLVLTVAGVYNLLSDLLQSGNVYDNHASLAIGIALLPVGAIILAYTWRFIQNSLVETQEALSQLRLVVLYAISLGSVVGVLSSAGSILNLLLAWLLQGGYTLVSFLEANNGQISALLPLGVVWWYFGGILNRSVAVISDQPRRAALRRLYYYILSALGLAVSYAGIISLAGWAARQVFHPPYWDIRNITAAQFDLRGALSALLVGLPLWIIPWRLMQSEAYRPDNAGDHARRSILRKTYLYLALFAMVIGAMVFTGGLLYALFNQLFNPIDSSAFASDLSGSLLSLVIDAALLVYHLQALRHDGRAAQRTLSELHAAFSMVVLVGEDQAAFAIAVTEATQRVMPSAPVTTAQAGSEPLMSPQEPKAVILPLTIALNPPLAWKEWLDRFNGQRVLVPLPAQGWAWIGQSDRSMQDLARDTAQAARQMAEGEAVRRSVSAGPWGIAGYLLGGLGALVMLAILFSIMMSNLFR